MALKRETACVQLCCFTLQPIIAIFRNRSHAYKIGMRLASTAANTEAVSKILHSVEFQKTRKFDRRAAFNASNSL